MSIYEAGGVCSITSIDDKETLSKALYEVVMMAINSRKSPVEIYEMVSLTKYKLEILLSHKDRGLMIPCSVGSNSVN